MASTRGGFVDPDDLFERMTRGPYSYDEALNRSRWIGVVSCAICRVHVDNYDLDLHAKYCPTARFC